MIEPIEENPIKKLEKAIESSLPPMVNSNFIRLQQSASVTKDNKAKQYSFRSLKDILTVIKPTLKEIKGTITFKDRLFECANLPFLESTAIYSDGEITKSSTAVVQYELDPKFMGVGQAGGSTASYCRKYALEGLLLIDENKDLDATADAEREALEVEFKELAKIKENKKAMELNVSKTSIP